MPKLTIWLFTSDIYDHQLLVEPFIAKQRELIDTPNIILWCNIELNFCIFLINFLMIVGRYKLNYEFFTISKNTVWTCMLQ